MVRLRLPLLLLFCLVYFATSLQLHDSIAVVPGFVASNAQRKDKTFHSGVSVVLCPKMCSATVAQTGGAPCTSQTDHLQLKNFGGLTETGVVLTGGSMFGLHGASSGAFQQLTEIVNNKVTMNEKFELKQSDDVNKRMKILSVEGYFLPSISSAAILDLGFQNSMTKGNAVLNSKHLIANYKMLARAAVRDAYDQYVNSKIHHLQSGCVGAGTGAVVGQFDFNFNDVMKGGLGSAAYHITDGVYIGAMVVVNVYGEVRDGKTILAGKLKHINATSYEYYSADEYFSKHSETPILLHGANTAIGAIFTNLKLPRNLLQKVNEMATHGVSDAVFPSATPYDGDTFFAYSSNLVEKDVSVSTLGYFASKAMSIAVKRAVCCAVDEGITKSVLNKKDCEPIYKQFEDISLCPGAQV